MNADNLLLVDLICGGVISEEVVKEYVGNLEGRFMSKMTFLSVRHKSPNWTPPFLYAKFENGAEYMKPFYETEYGFAFDNLKKTKCYHCVFKGDKHQSDITLGDAWGIKPTDAAFNQLGVSLAIVHSDKGYDKIRCLKDADLYSGDLEYMVNKNPRYSTSKPITNEATRFSRLYGKYGLFAAYRRMTSPLNKLRKNINLIFYIILKKMKGRFGN